MRLFNDDRVVSRQLLHPALLLLLLALFLLTVIYTTESSDVKTTHWNCVKFSV